MSNKIVLNWKYSVVKSLIILVVYIILSLIIGISGLFIVRLVPINYFNGISYNKFSFYIVIVVALMPSNLLYYQNFIKKRDKLIVSLEEFNKHKSVVSTIREHLSIINFNNKLNDNILYEIKILNVCLDNYIYKIIEGPNDIVFKKYRMIKFCIQKLEKSIYYNNNASVDKYLKSLNILLKKYEEIEKPITWRQYLKL